MKTIILDKTYEGKRLKSIFIFAKKNDIQLDMEGYERQYFTTLKEAKDRAKQMFETEIDIIKFG